MQLERRQVSGVLSSKSYMNLMLCLLLLITGQSNADITSLVGSISLAITNSVNPTAIIGSTTQPTGDSTTESLSTTTSQSSSQSASISPSNDSFSTTPTLSTQTTPTSTDTSSSNTSTR